MNESEELAAGSSNVGDAELRDSLAQLEQLLASPNCPDREQVLLMRDEIAKLLGHEDSSVDDQDSCSSVSSSSSASLVIDNVLIEQLIGHCCRAPYPAIRGMSYHNATILDVLPVPVSKFEDLEVPTASFDKLVREQFVYLFVDPLTIYQFSFSHGEDVRFGDLLDYEKPDFENVDEGTVCLVRGSGESLWQLATVLAVSREEGQVAVRLSETGAEIAVDFVNLFPLPTTTLSEEKPSSDDNDNSDADDDDGNSFPFMQKATSSAHSASFIGDWEKHTRGIGTKLMEKMGFVRGQGLGKEGVGRAEPIQVNVFSKGQSLDACFESKDSGNPLNRNKRAKRKERKRQEKLKSDYEVANKKDVFAFLNSTLNLQSSDRKRKADTDNIRNSTDRELNVKILKLEREIKETNERVLKLRRSSDNSNSFQCRVVQEKNKLLSLENELKRVTNELSDRKQRCVTDVGQMEDEKTSPDEHKRTDPLKNFIAGGVGGVCCVVTGHPFDTVKVRVQTASRPLSTLHCFEQTVMNEGFLALYKGMGAPVAGVAPLFALYFFGCSIGKRLQQRHPDEVLSIGKTFNAGALAGVLTTVIMAPGERIKCLLQVQHQSVGSGSAKYAGPIDVLRQLYKEGGLRSIYRGTMATLLRDVPASGAYLATYEFFMRSMTSSSADRNELSPAKTLLAGGLAGIANWAVCLPQDVLKSRLQIAPAGRYPNGVRDVARELIKEEGFTAFYKGFTPVMLRAFPANAAILLPHNCVTRFLRVFWTKYGTCRVNLKVVVAKQISFRCLRVLHSQRPTVQLQIRIEGTLLLGSIELVKSQSRQT
ncbi:g-patch domain protein [Trichuris suis]|nr:g-patch domain protein [Trichuris suis]